SATIAGNQLSNTNTTEPPALTVLLDDDSQEQGAAIDIQNYVVPATAGGGFSQSVAIANNVITNASANGIRLGNLLFAAVDPVQDATVSGNQIGTVSLNGILGVNSVYGTGSVLSQNLVIVGNSIGNAGENGIAVYSFLHRAGFESQALQIDANTIDHVTGYG